MIQHTVRNNYSVLRNVSPR